MDVLEALDLAEQGLTISVIGAIGRRNPGDASAALEKVRFEHRDMVVVV